MIEDVSQSFGVGTTAKAAARWAGGGSAARVLQVFWRKSGLFQYRVESSYPQVAPMHGHGNPARIAQAEKYPVTPALAAKDESMLFQNPAQLAGRNSWHALFGSDAHFDSSQKSVTGARDFLSAGSHVLHIQFDSITGHFTRFLHVFAIGNTAGKRRHRYGVAACRVGFEDKLKCLRFHVASVPNRALLSNSCTRTMREKAYA